MPALLSILCCLLALPLAAQTTDSSVYVVPPGPTTATPITVHASLWCEPGPATVTVTGKVIKVHFTAANGLCGDPPFLIPYSANVPQLLAAGEYRVDVSFGNTDEAMTTTFVVRHDERQELSIHPFAVPANVTDAIELMIPTTPDGSYICEPQQQCDIFIGNVRVASKTIGTDGTIRFPAPALAPGLYDARVERPGTDASLTAAVYYFDRGQEPNFSVFERILFPVLFNAPGANGSDWRSEAAVLNPRPWFVETFNDIQPIVCITYPCGERIHPESMTRFSGGSFPRGIALLAPREEAEDLTFSLRVRDVSREAEGFGTEVPVVREKDMYRDEVMTLLNVPLDPRYRSKLRLYAFDPFPTNASPNAEVIVRSGVSAERRMTPLLQRNCTRSSCMATPMYADVDLPAGAPGERADLYIRMPLDALSWAFVTVTNNVTQQVTIVTPDGKGGAPCVTPFAPCEEDL